MIISHDLVFHVSILVNPGIVYYIVFFFHFQIYFRLVKGKQI
jgi:hypothetical protein